MEKEKVYLDYNIYDKIIKDQLYRDKITAELKEKYDFYYSGAHAEELFYARCNSKGMYETEIRNRIACIEYITDKKKIVPFKNGFTSGLQEIVESVEESYEKVSKNDTTEYIKTYAQYKDNVYKKTKEELRQEDKKFIYLSLKNEKDIWDIDEIKDIIKVLNRININTTKIVKNSYNILKYKYDSLMDVVTSLFEILSLYGYNVDKGVKKVNSGVHDTSHAINATYCNKFITMDDRFYKRCKAVYSYLGINVEVLKLDEFLE